MAMTAVMKKKWISALKSGKYKQGTGKLKRKESDGTITYCCLGVLLDACVPGNWEGLTINSLPTFVPAGLEHHYLVRDLDQAARDLVGLTKNQQAILISMNDDKDDQKSFPQIADWIEKHIRVTKKKAPKKNGTKEK